MKLIWLFLTCISLTAFAQQKPASRAFHYQKEIKWSPVSIAFGAITFHYENYYNPQKSINVWGNVLDLYYANVIKGFGLGVGFRDYFTPERKNSYYIEPFIKYQFMTDTYANDRFNTTGIGIVLGKKWVFGKRISTEIFLGPSYNIGLYKTGNASSTRYPEWLGPINGMFGRAGINIGYRFN